MTDYHNPVLLKESVDGLNIVPEGVYVDLTFGSGGHSKEILKRIKGGKLIAFDHDIEAKQNVINDKRFVFVNGNLASDPANYVIAPFEKVPPGDQIKFIFTEKPAESINSSIG